MVSSISYSGKHFTVKRVDDNMRCHNITTTIRVTDVIEMAKTFTNTYPILDRYLRKGYMSRVVAKVVDILLKMMYSKGMIILDFKLMDLTNIKFDRDFDWSITIKVNGVDTILEYHISSKSWSKLFTRFFIRKYNKIKR